MWSVVCTLNSFVHAWMYAYYAFPRYYSFLYFFLRLLLPPPRRLVPSSLLSVSKCFPPVVVDMHGDVHRCWLWLLLLPPVFSLGETVCTCDSSRYNEQDRYLNVYLFRGESQRWKLRVFHRRT